MAEDIEVLPVVLDPVAGRPVTLALRLNTISTPACYWHVSPGTVTLTITSGKDHIWSSRECRRSVPTSDVVLRQTKPVWVRVRWSAKRSDEDCSKQTYWALPGWYHLKAAALAGEPEDVQFELTKPAAKVVTRGTKPDKKDERDRGRRNGQPSAEPSGAVEPDDPE